jgi:hypothetical protein
MEIKKVLISSDDEKDNRNEFLDLYGSSPIPKDEQLSNLGLFVKRQDLTKQLFFNEVYQEILDVHGVIMELGTRWGQNLVTLNNLRGIYEPYNHSRRIIGFDTFGGFPSVHPKDGEHDMVGKGSYSVTDNYEEYLNKVLKYHETECPLSHIKKNKIIKGDATKTLKKYLDEHPETIISFVYFDFDIYEPTKECLELIKPYLTNGSIIGFDELCDPNFPGETIALREVLGTNNIEIKRNKFSGIQSYVKYNG